MWWVLSSGAWATALTTCSASLPEGAPRARVRVACEGSSAPPGGPVSRFPMDVGEMRVTMNLRGVELGELTQLERREDGSAVYGLNAPLWPGLAVEVRGDQGLSVQLRPAGPDLTPIERCSADPRTCVAGARQVPDMLGPAMRLHACAHGVDCAAGRSDPVTDMALEVLAQGCTSRPGPTCERLAAIDPSVRWDRVPLGVPGSGSVRATGVRSFLLPSDRLEVGWGPRGPMVLEAGEEPAPRLALSARELRSDASGVALVEGRRELWRWSITDLDSASLDDDGQQLLVRMGRLVVWVGFDGKGMGPVDGLPQPEGTPRSGLLIGVDGWPRPGVRIRAACDASDAERRCVATTDLRGAFHLPGLHGDMVTVEDASGSARELAVIGGLPVRVPDGGMFDFEVGAGGQVVRAVAPLQPGDVVVAVGPLPVDREPVAGSGFSPVPPRLWAGVASQWGSVEVIRAGQRVTLRPDPPTVRESSMNAAQFDEIRAFILSRGDRQGYGNRYNDNPHFRFGAVDAYLDPEDPRNVACDPAVSGFDALMLRLVETPGIWVRVRAEQGRLRVEPPTATDAAHDAMHAMIATIRSRP